MPGGSRTIPARPGQRLPIKAAQQPWRPRQWQHHHCCHGSVTLVSNAFFGALYTRRQRRGGRRQLGSALAWNQVIDRARRQQTRRRLRGPSWEGPRT